MWARKALEAGGAGGWTLATPPVWVRFTGLLGAVACAAWGRAAGERREWASACVTGGIWHAVSVVWAVWCKGDRLPRSSLRVLLGHMICPGIEPVASLIPLCHISPPGSSAVWTTSVTRAWTAMACHASQAVWYRRLYMAASVLVLCNVLVSQRDRGVRRGAELGRKTD